MTKTQVRPLVVGEKARFFFNGKGGSISGKVAAIVRGKQQTYVHLSVGGQTVSIGAATAFKRI